MAAKGFRRQRLLDVKEILLQIEALALRQREDAHLQDVRGLAHTQQIKEAFLTTASDQERKAIFLGSQELMVRSRYTLQLHADIEQFILRARQSRDAVDVQRKLVEAATQAKQTLEKLKNHQNSAARLEDDRNDQRALDEVAARGYLRSSHGRAVG